MKKRSFLPLLLLALYICPAWADVVAALESVHYDKLVAKFPDRLPNRTLILLPHAPPVPFAEVSTVRPPTLLPLGETPYPADLGAALARLLEQRLANTLHKGDATIRFSDFLEEIQLRTATIRGDDLQDQEPGGLRWPFLQIKW